jgi:Flp pilus assembly protein TadG
MKHAIALAATAALALSACASAVSAQDPQDAFFANLTELCGQRFEGQVVTDDPVDADFRASRLLMHVRDCSATEIRIPFWVGDDHSRTWIITRNDADGLTLKHDHRDPDGTAHDSHWYGGDTATDGTATRQEFPVDQFSIDQFTAGGLTASVTNTWAVEVNPGETYVYELARENRLLRVAFDLTQPLEE